MRGGESGPVVRPERPRASRLLLAMKASDADVLPAVKLVSLLRETCEADGIDALVERSRSEYGLQPDWIQEAVQVAEQEAEELAKLFA